tara:strand:+ start:263 stop:541 length:279 start_codon:yes stop_codon:yes gene_type:complete
MSFVEEFLQKYGHLPEERQFSMMKQEMFMSMMSLNKQCVEVSYPPFTIPNDYAEYDSERMNDLLRQFSQYMTEFVQWRDQHWKRGFFGWKRR